MVLIAFVLFHGDDIPFLQRDKRNNTSDAPTHLSFGQFISQTHNQKISI